MKDIVKRIIQLQSLQKREKRTTNDIRGNQQLLHYGVFNWGKRVQNQEGKQDKELMYKKLRKKVSEKNKQIADLERELEKAKVLSESSFDEEGERKMLERMMVEEILDIDLVILDRGKEIENLKKMIKEKDVEHELEEEMIGNLKKSISDLEKGREERLCTLKAQNALLSNEIQKLKTSSPSGSTIRAFKSIKVEELDMSEVTKQIVSPSEKKQEKEEIQRKAALPLPSDNVAVGPTLDLLMLVMFGIIAHACALVWMVETGYFNVTMLKFKGIAQRVTDQYIPGCDGTTDYMALQNQSSQLDQELEQQRVRQELIRHQLHEVTEQLQFEIIQRETATEENKRIQLEYEEIVEETDVLKSQMTELQNELIEIQADDPFQWKQDEHAALDQIDSKNKRIVSEAPIISAESMHLVTNVSIGLLCAVVSFAALQLIIDRWSRDEKQTFVMIY